MNQRSIVSWHVVSNMYQTVLAWRRRSSKLEEEWWK